MRFVDNPLLSGVSLAHHDFGRGDITGQYTQWLAGNMERLRQAWGVIRSVLQEKFTFGMIKEIVCRGGLDPTRMSHLEQTSGGGSASKSQLLSAVDQQVGKMDQARIGQFLRIVTEEMLRRHSPVEPEFREALERLGWTIHDGHLIEVAVFDISELPDLPDDSHSDLVKAATRLRDGDLSGAVTAACAAVDAVTSRTYSVKNLGDAGSASFQEKVKRSFEARKTFDEIEQQLVGLGWEPGTASVFVKNLSGSLNQAAFVMQTMRSQMGDVHGTKPILKPLVFDSIKWATLIVRLLG